MNSITRIKVFKAKVYHETELFNNKRGFVKYIVNTDKQFMIDSIKKDITSKELDSLYNDQKLNTKIITGNPFEIKFLTKKELV